MRRLLTLRLLAVVACLACMELAQPHGKCVTDGNPQPNPLLHRVGVAVGVVQPQCDAKLLPHLLPDGVHHADAVPVKLPNGHPVAVADKDAVWNTHTIKHCVPFPHTVKDTLPNSKPLKDTLPNPHSIKNCLPNPLPVKDALPNPHPHPDALRHALPHALPHCDTITDATPTPTQTPTPTRIPPQFLDVSVGFQGAGGVAGVATHGGIVEYLLRVSVPQVLLTHVRAVVEAFSGVDLFPVDPSTGVGGLEVVDVYGDEDLVWTCESVTPSPTPSPTSTPSPSPSPTNTPAQSTSPSSSPSASPSPSGSPSSTRTPSPTASPSSTPSPTDGSSTATPSSSPSQSPSPTPRPSPTPTQTPSPSATSSPTPSPSLTPTTTPSSTPTPSVTPTPAVPLTFEHFLPSINGTLRCLVRKRHRRSELHLGSVTNVNDNHTEPEVINVVMQGQVRTDAGVDGGAYVGGNALLHTERFSVSAPLPTVVLGQAELTLGVTPLLSKGVDSGDDIPLTLVVNNDPDVSNLFAYETTIVDTTVAAGLNASYAITGLTASFKPFDLPPAGVPGGIIRWRVIAFFQPFVVVTITMGTLEMNSTVAPPRFEATFASLPEGQPSRLFPLPLQQPEVVLAVPPAAAVTTRPDEATAGGTAAGSLDVVAGQKVTWTAHMELPEGTATGATVVLRWEGAALVPATSISVHDIRTSSPALQSSCGPLAPATFAYGVDVATRTATLQLCTLSNTDRNNSVTEWLEVDFVGDVVVSPAFPRGATMGGTVTWFAAAFSHVSAVQPIAFRAAAIEPVTVSPSHIADVDASDVLTLRLQVDNAPPSDAPAYNVTLTDATLGDGVGEYVAAGVAVEDDAVAVLPALQGGAPPGVVAIIPVVPTGARVVLEYTIRMLASTVINTTAIAPNLTVGFVSHPRLLGTVTPVDIPTVVSFTKRPPQLVEAVLVVDEVPLAPVSVVADGQFAIARVRFKLPEGVSTGVTVEFVSSSDVIGLVGVEEVEASRPFVSPSCGSLSPGGVTSTVSPESVVADFCTLTNADDENNLEEVVTVAASGWVSALDVAPGTPVSVTITVSGGAFSMVATVTAVVHRPSLLTPDPVRLNDGFVDAGDLIMYYVDLEHSVESMVTAFNVHLVDAQAPAGTYTLEFVQLNPPTLGGPLNQDDPYLLFYTGDNPTHLTDGVIARVATLRVGVTARILFGVRIDAVDLGSVRAGPAVHVEWAAHPTRTLPSFTEVALTSTDILVRAPAAADVHVALSVDGVPTSEAPGGSGVLPPPAAVTSGRLVSYTVSVAFSEGVMPDLFFAFQFSAPLLAFDAAHRVSGLPADFWFTTSCGGVLEGLPAGVEDLLGGGARLELCDVANDNRDNDAGEVLVVRGAAHVSAAGVLQGTASTGVVSISGSSFPTVTVSLPPLVLEQAILAPERFPDTTVGLVAGDIVTYSVVLVHDAASTAPAYHLRVFDRLLTSTAARYSLAQTRLNGTVVYDSGGAAEAPHDPPPGGVLNASLAADGLLYYVPLLDMGGSIEVEFDFQVGALDALSPGFPGPDIEVTWASHPDSNSPHTLHYDSPSTGSTFVPSTSPGARHITADGVKLNVPPVGEPYAVQVRSPDPTACVYATFADLGDDAPCLAAMAHRGLNASLFVDCMTLRLTVPQFGGCLERQGVRRRRRLQDGFPELYVDVALPVDVLANVPPLATVGLAAVSGEQDAVCVASETYDTSTAVFSTQLCRYDSHAAFVRLVVPSPSPSALPFGERDPGGEGGADSSGGVVLIAGLVVACLVVAAVGVGLGVRWYRGREPKPVDANYVASDDEDSVVQRTGLSKAMRALVDSPRETIDMTPAVDDSGFNRLPPDDFVALDVNHDGASDSGRSDASAAPKPDRGLATVMAGIPTPGFVPKALQAQHRLDAKKAAHATRVQRLVRRWRARTLLRRVAIRRYRRVFDPSVAPTPYVYDAATDSSWWTSPLPTVLPLSAIPFTPRSKRAWAEFVPPAVVQVVQEEAAAPEGGGDEAGDAVVDDGAVSEAGSDEWGWRPPPQWATVDLDQLPGMRDGVPADVPSPPPEVGGPEVAVEDEPASASVAHTPVPSLPPSPPPPQEDPVLVSQVTDVSDGEEVAEDTSPPRRLAMPTVASLASWLARVGDGGDEVPDVTTPKKVLVLEGVRPRELTPVTPEAAPLSSDDDDVTPVPTPRWYDDEDSDGGTPRATRVRFLDNGVGVGGGAVAHPAPPFEAAPEPTPVRAVREPTPSPLASPPTPEPALPTTPSAATPAYLPHLASTRKELLRVTKLGRHPSADAAATASLSTRLASPKAQATRPAPSNWRPVLSVDTSAPLPGMVEPKALLPQSLSSDSPQHASGTWVVSPARGPGRSPTARRHIAVAPASSLPAARPRANSDDSDEGSVPMPVSLRARQRRSPHRRPPAGVEPPVTSALLDSALSPNAAAATMALLKRTRRPPTR